MQRDDFEKFAHSLAIISDVYGKSMSEGAIMLWWKALESYEFNQVDRAMMMAIRDSRFLPKPADIIRLIEGSVEDRASIAWGKVLEAASGVGGYQDVCFDDPIIHSAIMDCGGWPAICQTETENLSYTQHRFTECYRAYIGRKFDHPAVLFGNRSPDSEYEKKGLPIPRPILIGDRAKAMAVKLSGSKYGKTAIDFSGGSIKMIPENVH